MDPVGGEFKNAEEISDLPLTGASAVRAFWAIVGVQHRHLDDRAPCTVAPNTEPGSLFDPSVDRLKTIRRVPE